MTDATLRKFEEMIAELSTIDEVDEIRAKLDFRADEIDELDDDPDLLDDEDDE